MNKKELEKLIKKGESRNLEFKESLRLKDEMGEAVSAFSNTCDGTILLGVSDSGKIKGAETGNKTAEKLANYIKQHTDNPIYPDISVQEINNKNIIIIEVKEADEKPVFFKGKAYKRVGKSSHKLSASENRKLSKESSKTHWDEQICRDAGLDNIDWKIVKEIFMPLYEEVSEKKITGKPVNLLKSLGCIKGNKLTNSGILLFGKTPQSVFRNAYIALGRYRGSSVGGEKLDYKEFTGNLFKQIDSCNQYIVEHIALMSKLIPGEVRRRDIPEYGRFSVRELITNAVCHRDYEDQGGKTIIKIFDNRIEFYNIGSLPEKITPENIVSEQYSRNPTIAKVLAKVEYIEELGEGWDKIIEEHKKHLLTPRMPEIKSTKNSTLVTLFSTKKKFEKGRSELNERQEKAINYVRKKEKITNAEYQEINKTIKKTATRDLQDLVKREILIKKGRTGKGVHYILSSIYKGDIRGHKGTFYTLVQTPHKRPTNAPQSQKGD